MSTKARIATVCQSGQLFNSVEQNREYVLRLLDLAAAQGTDLVCLPETFTTASVPAQAASEAIESVPGPTTDAVAERARQHRCYVICPIQTRRQGNSWNSAVVIDRSGSILGIYDKIHPVTTSSNYTSFEDGLQPASGLPTFDLDFGRIGIQICFDIGFPECWEQLARQGARIVFWPSAYNGGFPLQAYAYLHHYYVVSSVHSDKSKIIDPCGVILAETDQLANVIYRDINLDYLVCHYDFNQGIPDRILATYPGRVEIRSHRDDAHFLVEPTDPTLTTAQLQRELGFESTWQYRGRHREAYARILEGKPPLPQQAAHGDRAEWSK
jgi:predicted amidohydrolase